MGPGLFLDVGQADLEIWAYLLGGLGMDWSRPLMRWAIDVHFVHFGVAYVI